MTLGPGGDLVELRPLSPHEVALHRDVRLRALRDSPGSFAESFADTVLGSTYGLLDPEHTDAGRVGGMWVDPAWRRRGVGGALLENLRRWAHTQGLQRLGLWAPAASPAAIRLYSRAGFRDTGLRQHHPLDPSLTLMEMVTEP